MAKEDKFSEQEARQRLEAALRGSRAVGHKTYEESKVGKPRAPRPKGHRKARQATQSKP